MANLIARILLISDFHWMIVPPWKQKGQTEEGFLGKIIEFFISVWKLFNNNAARKALEKISKMGPFTKVILLGDLAECEWNERGIILPNDIRELAELKKLIESSVKAKREDFHYLAGDHELGYTLPLSSDPGGGISRKSIDNFQSVFGPLYTGFSIGEFHFLLLSSSLLTQKSKNSEFQKLKKDQFEIFDSMLEKISEAKDVFIFLHDPDGLREIQSHFDIPYLGSYYLRNKNFHAFCGHMHAEDSLKKYQNLGRIANAKSLKEKILKWLFNCFKKGVKVMEWAKGNLRRVEIFKKYDLQIVPSTAGMMGRGGGFLVLNLYDDGTYSVEKHKI